MLARKTTETLFFIEVVIQVKSKSTRLLISHLNCTKAPMETAFSGDFINSRGNSWFSMSVKTSSFHFLVKKWADSFLEQVVPDSRKSCKWIKNYVSMSEENKNKHADMLSCTGKINKNSLPTTSPLKIKHKAFIKSIYHTLFVILLINKNIFIDTARNKSLLQYLSSFFHWYLYLEIISEFLTLPLSLALCTDSLSVI